jgi:Family of unknown function (DUF5522)
VNNPEEGKSNLSTSVSEEVDFYLNEQGFIVFTQAYHLKRGYCCGNGCLHCPYGIQNIEPTNYE